MIHYDNVLWSNAEINFLKTKYLKIMLILPLDFVMNFIAFAHKKILSRTSFHRING